MFWKFVNRWKKFRFVWGRIFELEGEFFRILYLCVIGGRDLRLVVLWDWVFGICCKWICYGFYVELFCCGNFFWG